MIVRLYSKPRCGLCEEMKAVLERVRERVPFELLEEDIRADPALLSTYRYDIPVVIIGGLIAFKHRATEDEVELYLRRALSGTPVADS